MVHFDPTLTLGGIVEIMMLFGGIVAVVMKIGAIQQVVQIHSEAIARHDTLILQLLGDVRELLGQQRAREQQMFGLRQTDPK